MEQKVSVINGGYARLGTWIEEQGVKKIMAVSGNSIKYRASFIESFKKLTDKAEVICFSQFQANPSYESVAAGVKLFRMQSCDAIIAVGGGSAMDVAKCIKLYSNMEGDGADGEYLRQKAVPNAIPFLAVPTTAGSGSEATRFAVIYYKGEKQSITSESVIPGTVLMDGGWLETLPLYQKKATMMDAFCHALESFWSVNSTDESKRYSREAIDLILENMDGYLENTQEGNQNMLLAAHRAGKAINITQTTAGHAMCYKITSLFGIAHGHAAILCDRVLFPWMVQNTEKCIDPRGERYLVKTFSEIAYAMGCRGTEDASKKLQEIFGKLGLSVPIAAKTQYEELNRSVNPVRLKNHPTELTTDTIDMLYHKILSGQQNF